jgi:hypothetical protein
MNGEPNRASTLRVALLNQYNLALLGAATLFSVALASPWPLLLAGTGEVVWLGFALSSRRVRRWTVRHVLEQDNARRVTETTEWIRELEPAYATRVEKLEALGRDIREVVWQRQIGSMLQQAGENQLEALLLAFVRMAVQHQRLSRLAKPTSASKLGEEVLGLGQSLSAEHDPSARSVLMQALSIAQRRLQQQDLLESQLRVLGYRMGTLEMSLEYLRSQIVAGRPEHELSAEVAQLVATLTPPSDVDGPETTAQPRRANVTTETEIPGVRHVGHS